MGSGPSPPVCLRRRLKPFTSYKFRVKATNDIGDSAYSEESESLTTLQAGQCPPCWQHGGSLPCAPRGVGVAPRDQGSPCQLAPIGWVAQRRSHLGLHACVSSPPPQASQVAVTPMGGI